MNGPSIESSALSNIFEVDYLGRDYLFVLSARPFAREFKDSREDEEREGWRKEDA